ncbi:MAG: DUF932 domain-containing protein [Clostridia bacterium]|nr:DUF932 domain-containing protein [Clostridia bacterium]
MKPGLTLEALAAEILRQKDAKEDYLVDTPALVMEPNGDDVVLRVLDEDKNDRIEPLDIGEIAHRQIGTHLSIPAKYYAKMLAEKPELLCVNVNSWMESNPSTRMLRVMDGRARAYLSNRYQRFDHYEIANAVLPILGEMPDAQFESCQITEGRLYIKVVNPRLQAEVTPGDIVQSGLIISNSEVGLGSVTVQPLVYRLVCSNGMIVNDAATKRNHIGRANNSDENFQLYTPKTLEADYRAFLLKIQDTVRAAVDEAQFARVVGMMQEASTAQMNTADVPGLVKLASREFGITESEEPGVLQHLIEDGNLTLYGLSNAVTRFSQDVESYDRATDLEGIGYNILTMPANTWNRLNRAAA